VILVLVLAEEACEGEKRRPAWPARALETGVTWVQPSGWKGADLRLRSIIPQYWVCGVF